MTGWDYSSNGAYFITFVTQNRKRNLGKIKEAKMILSDFGEIVFAEWQKSFEIRHELFCNEFIIMPDHLHAILIIDQPNGRVIPPTQSNHSNFYRMPKSISSFIAGFKSAVNSKIDDYIDFHKLDIPKYNRNNHFFQPNYHDHVIRSKTEYHRIKKYTINNPQKWEDKKRKSS